jgi:ketosteroid isomerase-like protein
MNKFFVAVSVVCFFAVAAFAQNSNSSTVDSSATPTRTRTIAPPKPSPTPRIVTKPATTPATPSASPKPDANESTSQAGPAAGVLAAFERIIEGVRKADVDLATGGYWNSAALVLFNYDGSVTKGWKQMRENRETSYPDVKENRLEIRERNIVMLGRDGALVTCLWTQSRVFRGEPDTASGRMTLVFKRFGTAWKAVHLHTSPDKPDPSRIPPSEQTTPRPN